MDAIDKLEQAGATRAEIARLLKISKAAVGRWWVNRKVPVERVNALVHHYPELKRSDLRPDIFGDS